MKKSIVKGIILVAIFLLGIYFLTVFRDKEDVDQVTTMAEPTIPTLYLTSYEENLNELHGYTEEMEANYMRDTITPLPDDRALPITIRNYGTKIEKISYEVRSLDTTRLVEQTQVTDFQENDDSVTAVLNIKNLLEEDTEYILKIIVTTDKTENINYYTRIIKDDSLYVKEKIDFIKDFNTKTFSKEAAKDLVIYLESNSTGDNSSFNKVTINSTFDQVTWGSLDITQVTEPIPQIKEIDAQTASVILTYVVSVQNENDVTEYYNITEYYRMRYTQDRNYLLDFERSMNQIFDEKNVTYKDNRLTLGIRDQEIDYKENSSGTMVAFVQEGELYSINLESNKIVKIYGLKDDVLDSRENYDQYDIKILNVDDEGNISFLVYGYMTRGEYEGKVGVNVLNYSSTINTLEESIFIPSVKSYQILKESINRFVYQNNQNKLYMDIDNSIYCIDLLAKSEQEVVSNINPEGYVISKDDGIIAWQNEEDAQSSTSITIMDLSNELKSNISVGEDERVMPIGFMDEDFIYGVAKTEDIITDATGAILFPMYCIRIQDNTGETIEEYKPNGIYIVNAQIQNNVIKLTRATLSETGYTYVEDDSIMNSLEAEEGKTKANTIVTDTKKEQMQLIFASNFSETAPVVISPKLILAKEDMILKLKTTKNPEEKYYVYAKGVIQGIYRNVSSAVIEADSLYGVVVDDNQDYIWERGNRLIRTNISGISANKDQSQNSLATCLDAILELEGSNIDAASFMERGENAVSILSKHMEGKVIELSNTSLSAALYYVSKGTPVIAKLNDSTSVLIVGYDELNISVMNPETGTIYKIGMNDSANVFEQAGNQYITYIKQ